MPRTVKYLIPAADIQMDGLPIKQAIPTANVRQVDPFLLLHHAEIQFHDYQSAKHQGIGPHPHRGFTPVTFVIAGEVHHRDSFGNNQIAKAGEVQWMHAGAGIIHSERPSAELAAQNGTQEIIQLWINSPSHKKMQPPLYQFVAEDQIPFFLSEDKQIRTKLIAGSYEDIRSDLRTESELIVMWSKATQAAKTTFSIPTHLNTMIYLVKGQLKVEGYGLVDEKQLVVFNNDEAEIALAIEREAEFLVLAGKPLNEKVVQQGPFVMNSETDVLKAMRDYQMGKMGILIED